MKPSRMLVAIIAVIVMALAIIIPSNTPLSLEFGPLKNLPVVVKPTTLNLFGRSISIDFPLKQGLDLQGGAHVVLQADMSSIAQEDKTQALESAKTVISRRVDLFGVSEPVIQTSVVDDEYRIIVELAGITDINQALDLIGQTAQLDFRELSPEASQAATIFDFIPTQLSGKNLKRAQVQFGQTGAPEVSILFDEEGSKLFSEITGRNINKPLAIFLDGLPVTTPTVNQQIVGGQAVITGNFDTETAKNLSIQLNAGALPVPIEIIEQKNIGATLGQESVQKSIRAGIVGLSMVMLFMVLSYRGLGIIASIALLIYGVITLALYKLIPVTVTLPGLAGFILSVGMAVDSNILIFERLKEELRLGKRFELAMELAFGRAWDSIKDANIATLITAFILFNPLDWSFLNSSGMVRGFALTLSLGIAISLFTGIIVTRTLLRLFYKPKTTKA